MKRYMILHNAFLGYINSSHELRMLRIVPGARQYLTEIKFMIPHLLASGLQILKLTGSSNSTHENSREEGQN